MQKDIGGGVPMGGVAHFMEGMLTLVLTWLMAYGEDIRPSGG